MKRLWKKRLLALFLSVSMLLTLVPSAFALGGGDGNGGQGNGLTWKQVDNSAVSAPIGREETEEPEVQPLYDDNEEVRVSIVLEEEPTLARFSLDGKGGLSGSAKAYREKLRSFQADAAAYISEEVLDDEPLDVVWNLTLAANIISANVRYGEIEDIRALDGVEDVIVETRYEIQGFPVEADPQMVISTGMTNTTQTWDLGYTGAGMRIAIIDTGLDIEHQSFDNDAFLHALNEVAGEAGKQLSDYELLDAAEIAGVLDELNANIDTVTADSLYYNEKLPFCFNYVDGDLDVTHWNDSQGEHGSHVAGIAAANRYLNQDGEFVKAAETNGVFMCGDAPDAQVLVMKVFGKGGGAYDSDYFAAIEDAIVLNCDTVNLSLGSGSAGMSFASGKYQEIMDDLVSANTVVTMSAGNNSYWAEETAFGLPYSDDVSFHTSSSPGSYANSLAVASVDNNGMVAPGLITAFGRTMTYMETIASGYTNEPIATLDPEGTGTEYEFVYVDTIGGMYDFMAVDVEDKIAICNRGELDFSEKALNAVDEGAIAVIICNNQAGTFGMDLSDYAEYELTAPVVAITQDNAGFIKEHAEKTTVMTAQEDSIDVYTGTLTITGAMAAVPGTDDHLTMSAFSSWGVPGDLSLKPEITAPGGNIWSLDGLGEDHDAYESMSGTSMAAPQMAGIGALVKQSIEERGYSARTDVTDRALVQSLMMSTATPLKDADENYYPVFQQGAGMVNTLAAVNADSYILMSSDATASHNDGKVKVELGDDPHRTGSYSFTFTINNLKDVPLSYTLDADVFTQAYEYNDESAHYHLATGTMPLENADFDYSVVSATAGVSGTKYDFDGSGAINEDDGNALLDFVTGKRQSISHQENADMSGDGQVSSYDGYVFLQNSFAAGDTVNVPANGSVTIRATIELDQDEMAEILQYCPNGVYVEAYVKVGTAANEEGALGTSHSIPVLGFYGNWTDPSMYERGNALDYLFDLEKGDTLAFFDTLEENGYPYLFDGTPASVYANRLMYQKAGEKGAYYFGGNPYISDDEYLPERNALSSVSGAKISRWNYMAIRNAAAGRVLIRDTKTDAVYMELPLGSISAAYYYAGANSWMNTGNAASINWAGTGSNGRPLPEGTEVELSLTLAPELYVDGGNVNWDALGKGASQTMILAIDNTAPELRNAEYDGASKTLSITVKDNRYTAYVALTNADGTRILDARSPNQAPDDKGKAITLDFDMSNIVGTDFNVVLGDYANNLVTYRLEGRYDPGMDLAPDIDAYYYGYNQWSGEWVAYTRDGTQFAVVGYGLNTEKGDLDNAYLTAGAYARGYVFAMDDQGNFYAFAANKDLPLIGDGQWIAQGGPTVYDMAYDAKNGTMYLSYESYVRVDDDFGGIGDDDFGVAVNTDDDDFGGFGDDDDFGGVGDDDDFGGIGDDGPGTLKAVIMLGTIDLITGEITEIDQLSDDDGFNYSCALACDDEGNLYELEYCEFWDEEGELGSASALNRLTANTYYVEKTKLADVNEAGDAFNWLAWDSSEGKLVLSVGDNVFGEDVLYDFVTNIYTVDPETGKAELAIELTENEHQLTAMFVDSDPNAEKIPDTAEASKVTLSETSLYLAPGSSEKLTAVVAPWNLTNKALTWSSSDPAVAAVDQSGTIRTLSPGTAVITAASAATPGVKASCEVEVAKLDQELNALIWTDHVDWVSFPVAEPESWTPIQESDRVFASAVMSDGKLYAATLDDREGVSNLYSVDPTTYKSTLLGTIGEWYGGIFTSDLAEIPGTGYLLGLYGNYIMEIDPEDLEMVPVWDMNDFGYTTYLVASAYLGESTIHDTIAVDYDEDGYPTDFEEGDWDVHVYALIDFYGGVFYFAFTDEGDAWIDFYGETDYQSEELWYSSAVYAYNEDGKPTLFWTYYTGESSQLIAISLDGGYDEGLACSVLGEMGEFGDDAWPVVGLMSAADTPALPASVSAVLNSGRMQRTDAAQTVRKLDDKAELAGKPERTGKEPAGTAAANEKAAVPETLSTADSINVAESLVDSQSGKVELKLSLDESSANGLIKVEYDARALKLTGVDGNAVLNSANDREDGVVVYAYAYKSARAAGTTVATLTFTSRTLESTALTVTTLERGTDALENVETVYIQIDVPAVTTMPVTPTQPDAPGTIPVISVPAAPDPERAEELIAPYTDLQSGKWYSDYAAYMIDSGLMTGISATDFAPNSSLTRGMLVTILYRAAGQPAAGDAPFSDVPAGKWYTNGVAWAAGSGLVVGRSEEIFDPNGNITRQELAVILWRFAKAMGLSVSANGTTMPDFADRGEIAGWAGEAMAWAYHSGIINGRDSSHLAPTDGASRIEAAAMVVRFLKLVESSQAPSV